eukprot:TRINITY_DN3157_c0_g1_i2.p3 TRINITY_DN3157_c0_g1~~TRINITY_DN3157_c0_g1_i2.p3  ORF type:complete len:183 (-),score=3.41 TRINITY_DN3157_c0_g1_i2:1357-1905(-)
MPHKFFPIIQKCGIDGVGFLNKLYQGLSRNFYLLLRLERKVAISYQVSVNFVMKYQNLKDKLVEFVFCNTNGVVNQPLKFQKFCGFYRSNLKAKKNPEENPSPFASLKSYQFQVFVFVVIFFEKQVETKDMRAVLTVLNRVCFSFCFCQKSTVFFWHNFATNQETQAKLFWSRIFKIWGMNY